MKAKDLSELKALIDEAKVVGEIKRAFLSSPKPFLDFVNESIGKRIVIDEFDMLQPWAIAVIAAMGRINETNKIFVENQVKSGPAKFAFSMGLDDIINGKEVHGVAEAGRTVKLCCLNNYEQIEPISESISKLIISDAGSGEGASYFDAEEARKTIRYVMVELLRNVIQHSDDKNGAIIIAQRMDKDPEHKEPNIQIAVVDRGIGIYESLKATRPAITNAQMALERSIWPYYSGKFYEYQHGSTQNAGLGLFFVSEMAKLTSGRVLIASRGATLLIQGDPEALGNNKIELIDVGFDGTLVAFEMPKRGVADYDSLIKRIVEIALERQEKKEKKRWIRFDIPPEGSLEFLINIASENTVKAEEFAKNELIPRIKDKQILVLNFVQMQICTQSYMHSLLFKVVKTAYDLKVPLYAKGTSATIADGIKLVEMYGL